MHARTDKILIMNRCQPPTSGAFKGYSQWFCRWPCFVNRTAHDSNHMNTGVELAFADQVHPRTHPKLCEPRSSSFHNPNFVHRVYPIQMHDVGAKANRPRGQLHGQFSVRRIAPTPVRLEPGVQFGEWRLGHRFEVHFPHKHFRHIHCL